MTNMMRRRQRGLAALLIALNLTGARAVSASGANRNGPTVFTAGLHFKAITKTVIHECKSAKCSHFLGETEGRRSGRNVAVLRRSATIAAIPILTASDFALALETPRAGPAPSWKLPSDCHPVQPLRLQI